MSFKTWISGLNQRDRNWLIGIGVLIGLGIFGQIMERKENQLDQISAEEQPYDTSEVYSKEEVAKLETNDSLSEIQSKKESLNKYTSAIETLKSSKSIIMTGSKEAIISSLSVFEGYQEMANDSYGSDNPEISKMKNKLKSLLKSRQQKDFPKLRKAYAEVMRSALWRENIEVACTGKLKKTLTLTGGTFASNANVEDSYSALRDALVKLRFKRINFKWYEYDDEYTYYNITSDPDNKI